MLKLNFLKHAFVFIFFLFVSSVLYGQINIEAQRKTNDLNGFFNKIRLTGNLASGNSEYASVSGRWESNFVHNKFQTFLVSDADYKSGDSKRLVNKAFAHLREVYAVNDLTSIEFFEQAAYNEFIKLQIRGLGGGGMRLNVFHDTTGWQKKSHLLWVLEQCMNMKNILIYPIPAKNVCAPLIIFSYHGSLALEQNLI